MFGYLCGAELLNSWSRCPLEVAILLGKFLNIKAEVRPGKLVRWLRLMARRRVDFTGLKVCDGYEVVMNLRCRVYAYYAAIVVFVNSKVSVNVGKNCA